MQPKKRLAYMHQNSDSPHSQTVGLYTRAWHHVSAKQRTLGPLAVSIAKALMGKDKPHYDSSVDAFGDYVVVTSAREVKLTGKKETQKKYYKHTGYPGGLKVKTVAELRQERPEQVRALFFFPAILLELTESLASL